MPLTNNQEKGLKSNDVVEVCENGEEWTRGREEVLDVSGNTVTACSNLIELERINVSGLSELDLDFSETYNEITSKIPIMTFCLLNNKNFMQNLLDNPKINAFLIEGIEVTFETRKDKEILISLYIISIWEDIMAELDAEIESCKGHLDKGTSFLISVVKSWGQKAFTNLEILSALTENLLSDKNEDLNNRIIDLTKKAEHLQELIEKLSTKK